MKFHHRRVQVLLAFGIGALILDSWRQYYVRQFLWTSSIGTQEKPFHSISSLNATILKVQPTSPTNDIDAFEGLCRECVTASIATGLTCGARIRRWMVSGDTLQEAQLRVSQEFGRACSACDPMMCPKKEEHKSEERINVRSIDNDYTTGAPEQHELHHAREKCNSTFSLHQLCLDMMNISSPPGSPSFQKMLNILQISKTFEINIRDVIFQDVVKNIQRMLVGSGLHPQDDHPQDDQHTLYVETVVSRPSVCDRIDCQKNISRILIQTEQLYAVGKKFLSRILACHESPICMIWDFSDYHYAWYKEQGFTDSVMLIPIMTQARLGDLADENVIPLEKRTIDVAFFGLMTNRRKPLMDALMADSGLNVQFSQTKNIHLIQQTYTNTKVCLIAHSYIDVSAGETHRLSEIGRFGCIPVVETWGDKKFLENYQSCGDVVFSDYKDLLNQTIAMLSRLQNAPAHHLRKSLYDRLDWWREGIHWESVLTNGRSTENKL